MVAQFSVQFRTDVLCCSTLWTSDDGDYAHGDDDGEEARDDAIHDIV